MEAGVPLGEFWAIGKTGQGHVPAPAFPHPRPQDVSPCACSLSGPEFGRKVQRPRLLPAPGRMLLPLQACPARGPISAQRFPTRHAERASQDKSKTKTSQRPFPERPAISKSRAVRSRLPLSQEAGRQVSLSNCGQ